MELRRFRYFVAVAEELHFRRAAERLHLAQPALSQQVRKLELELGADLLHRTKRGVSLTAAGTVFLDEARRLLRQADEAARVARDARTGAAGRLRVGHLADAMPVLLPRAIALFASQCPGIEVSPERMPARRAIEDVRAGRLDVAAVGLPAPTADLKVTPLAVEGTVAAVADRHPLSGRRSIALSSLSETQVVLLPRATNPAFYDGVLGAYRSIGIAPSLVETAEPQVDHALLLVAGGTGVALLPSSAAERYSTAGVRFLPVEAPAPTTEIGLVTRADSNEASVAIFLRIARTLGRSTRPAIPGLAGVQPLSELPLTA